MSHASWQTLWELITDGGLESETNSLFKKSDFLFRDSIDEDVEVMLDGSYKWLYRLGTPTLIFYSSRAKQEKKSYTINVITPLSQLTRIH